MKLALKCPRIFIFNKFFNKKPFPYTGLILGSIVHNILDKTVKQMSVCDMNFFLKNSGEIDNEKFIESTRNFVYRLYYEKIITFSNKYQKLEDLEKNSKLLWNLIEQGLKIIFDLLKKAFKLYPSNEAFTKTFLTNEQTFTVSIPEINNNFKLRARIDSLWMDQETKEVFLIDFKTNTEEFFNSDIVQLALYAYVVYKQLKFKPKYVLYYLKKDGINKREVEWSDMEVLFPTLFQHIKLMLKWAKNIKKVPRTSTPHTCLSCHLYSICNKRFPNDPPYSPEDLKYFTPCIESKDFEVQNQDDGMKNFPEKKVYPPINHPKDSDNKAYQKIDKIPENERLYLGKLIQNEEKSAFLDVSPLNRHITILGTPGTGKTVLAKVIIEELLLQGYSCILIDPQGDLCSLLLPTSDSGSQLSLNTTFKIFTPGSRKGIPLNLNFFEPPSAQTLNDSNEEEYVNMILDDLSLNILNFLGIDMKKGIPSEKPLLESVILKVWHDNCDLDFQKLAEIIADTEEIKSITSKKTIQVSSLISKRNKQNLVQKLTSISAGTEGILFSSGEKLNIEEMIQNPPTCCIITLQSVGPDQNKRQLILSWIIRQIYNWMLTHPQKEQDFLRLLFYIDEVADFLPIHPLNPPSKKMLMLLLRQARKFGVGVMMATQSIGSIEYKALDNVNTIFIGKVPTKQSAKKIESLIAPYLEHNPVELNRTMTSIRKLKPGQFYVIHPGDLSKSFIKVRQLYSKHETISLDRIKDLL